MGWERCGGVFWRCECDYGFAIVMWENGAGAVTGELPGIIQWDESVSSKWRVGLGKFCEDCLGLMDAGVDLGRRLMDW